MTMERFLWVFSVCMVPAIFYAGKLYLNVVELLQMHKEPDRYGFGTVSVNKIIKSNTEAFDRMAGCLEDIDSVLRWLATKIDGDTPPLKIRTPTKSRS